MSSKVETIQPDQAIAIRPSNELQMTTAATSALQEIQGAMFLAKQFPRDYTAAWSRLMEACKRKTLAEKASYSFPRGEGRVVGPSVNLARVAAQNFNNIRWGLNILRDDDETMLIEGWAWDIENNCKVTAQDQFKKLIYRKKEGWIKPDERDLRELVNRRGAILVRNCLLQIMPRDFIEDAQAECAKTLLNKIKDAKGEQKRLILEFANFRVSVEMLREYIGNDDWNADNILELQGVLTALREGAAKREDYFTLKAAATDETPANGITTASMSAGDASLHQGHEKVAQHPTQDPDPEEIVPPEQPHEADEPFEEPVEPTTDELIAELLDLSAELTPVLSAKDRTRLGVIGMKMGGWTLVQLQAAIREIKAMKQVPSANKQGKINL